MTLKEDIIECWYYETEAEARENDTGKSVGYTRVEMSTLKEHTGRETKYCHLKSKTVVASTPIKKKKVNANKGKHIVFTELPEFDIPQALSLTPTSNTNVMPYTHNEDKEVLDILNIMEAL